MADDARPGKVCMFIGMLGEMERCVTGMAKKKMDFEMLR